MKPTEMTLSVGRFPVIYHCVLCMLTANHEVSEQAYVVSDAVPQNCCLDLFVCMHARMKQRAIPFCTCTSLLSQPFMPQMKISGL